MWNLLAKFNLDFISAPDWLSFLFSLFFSDFDLKTVPCHLCRIYRAAHFSNSTSKKIVYSLRFPAIHCVSFHKCAMPSKSSSQKIITMPSSSSKVSLLTCQNPFCNRFNQKPFSNQTAYTNHIDESPGCFNSLVR
jgi:hypothetical protein